MPDKDRVPAGQYMAGDLSMAGEDTTERRRAPLELHINTILTGVITAGIIGLAAMLWNMYTELVKINQVINTLATMRRSNSGLTTLAGGIDTEDATASVP